MPRFGLPIWRHRASGHRSLRATTGKGGGRAPTFTCSRLVLFRKGHYIVSDYVDKVHNRIAPTFPWDVSLTLDSMERTFR